MIGLILGTSEGKYILSKLNAFTDELFVSTATTYGGELLQNFKYQILNTKPLDDKELIQVIKKHHIEVFVDASHPYAVEITKNVRKACEACHIKYLRYERPSVLEEFKHYEKVVGISSYEELEERLRSVDGNILNTTGSRNIEKILNLQQNNRIIHRILPTKKVVSQCIELGIKVDNLIAIKGPISYPLNFAFIKEYDAKAIILKDSGEAGGTKEKLQAAIDAGIYAFVIEREKQKTENVFYDIEALIIQIRNTVGQ